MKRRKSLMIPAMLLLGLFFISGCGDGVPEGTLNTTGATITVVSNMDQITTADGLVAGQSCIITATLMDNRLDPDTGDPDSRPLSGQELAFSFVTNESGAKLIALNGGITNKDGQAFAIYVAGKDHPGLYVQDGIQANIRGITGAILIPRIGAAAQASGYNLTLTTTGNATTVAYRASLVITATVRTVEASPVPIRNVNVTFAIVDNKSGATLSVLSGRTDAAGRVLTVYTSGTNNPNVSVQDVIQATVTDAGVTSSTDIMALTRTAVGLIGNTITVAADPAALASSSGSTTVTATVLRNSDSQAVPDEEVVFSVATGGGSIAPTSRRTDFTGKAVVVFTGPGGAAGEAIIRATLTDGLSVAETTITWP